MKATERLLSVDSVATGKGSNLQNMSNLTERHQHIMVKLKKEGSVAVVELCEELNVSSVTIRRT